MVLYFFFNSFFFFFGNGTLSRVTEHFSDTVIDVSHHLK